MAATVLLFARPQYTATAELFLGVGSVGIATASAALADSQIETLKSEQLARSVVDKLGLWNDTELACPSRGLVQRLINSAGGDCGPNVDRETVLSNFKNATTVRRFGDSFVGNVAFTSSDPQKAAAVVNVLAQTYVDYRSRQQSSNVEQAGTRLENHIARLRDKSAAASRELQKIRDAGAAQPPSNDQVHALESQSQAYQSIYRALLEQYARYVREQAIPVAEARVISEAVPPTYWSAPNVTELLLSGAGAGLLLGIAAAMRKEHAAHPVRSLDQIERDIGVRALGIVPLVEGRRLYPALHQAPPLLLHDWGDALRGMKIAVNEICEREPCVIGIMSAFQGEGKSTVAFNLAVLEAETGKRVLLVDANLHRPSLGRSLPAGTLLPSLEGRAELSSSVTRSEFGFDFVGECSADFRSHPTVLLGSTAMRSLIGSAREHYDCIVFDLPNVLGHADVLATADIFDALVMVTEWGRTPSAAAARAAVKSAAISSKLVGVLINKAPPRWSAMA